MHTLSGELQRDAKLEMCVRLSRSADHLAPSISEQYEATSIGLCRCDASLSVVILMFGCCCIDGI